MAERSGQTDGGAVILQVNLHLMRLKKAIWEARSLWKDIGRALGVSEGTISSIDHSTHREENPNECLHKVLTVWMQTGKATIYDLLTALEDDVVQRNDIANAIRAEMGLNM